MAPPPQHTTQVSQDQPSSTFSGRDDISDSPLNVSLRDSSSGRQLHEVGAANANIELSDTNIQSDRRAPDRFRFCPNLSIFLAAKIITCESELLAGIRGREKALERILQYTCALAAVSPSSIGFASETKLSDPTIQRQLLEAAKKTLAHHFATTAGTRQLTRSGIESMMHTMLIPYGAPDESAIGVFKEFLAASLRPDNYRSFKSTDASETDQSCMALDVVSFIHDAVKQYRSNAALKSDIEYWSWCKRQPELLERWGNILAQRNAAAIDAEPAPYAKDPEPLAQRRAALAFLNADPFRYDGGFSLANAVQWSVRHPKTAILAGLAVAGAGTIALNFFSSIPLSSREVALGVVGLGGLCGASFLAWCIRMARRSVVSELQGNDLERLVEQSERSASPLS